MFVYPLTRQALGRVMDNEFYRLDKITYGLYFPEIPVCFTRGQIYSERLYVPIGTNSMIAMMSL